MNIKKSLIIMLAIVCAAASSCKQAAPYVPPVPAPEEPDEPSDPWPEEGMEGKLYLNNGIIQIGIDLDRGGCIFHMSEVETKTNLLNHFDAGRFVQQSYYGNEDGSVWTGQAWRYNPVQGGGWNGCPAKVEATETYKTKTYERTIPVHWAKMEALDECRMEQTVYLKGKVAKIHYKFTYNGTKIHNNYSQEIPAFFVNWEYGTLAYYAGIKPWSDDELKKIQVASVIPAKGSKIASSEWTEKWAAYLDSKDWGIGIYSPSSTFATYYRYGDGKKVGSTGDSCSYLAPLTTFALSPGLVFEYDVFLTVGSIGQIRNNFYKIHETL